MAGTERLRVYAASKGLRRFSAGFVTLLAAYAVFVLFAEATTANRVVAVLLLIGHLPIAAMNLSYLEVDEDGMVVDQRFRRRRVAWGEIAALRLRWGWRQVRAAVPEIELTDGGVIRSSVLNDLRRPRRLSERDALIARLRAESEAHGFTLDLHGVGLPADHEG